tara:strand:- start:152 stop:946 length:795 start_codon:yes stop_codon:yes gene_type:complete
MKNYLYIGILLICLFLIFKPDISKYNPSQEEIQNENYIDKTQSVKDYPYPQISRTFKRLSHGKPIVPFEDDKSLPNGDEELTITRTDLSNTKQRMYLPDYYRKDRLSGNTIGSEELRPFLTDEQKSESSWTDTNVSEHPKFYNSDVKDNLTNIGSFFDKNNQYFDKTSVNTNALPSDKCYLDKMGNQFCEENTRLQNIPPKLISDPNCPVLNTIGYYKEENNIDDMKDKLINGGIFYDNIKGSLKENETFSSFNNNPLVVDINF